MKSYASELMELAVCVYKDAAAKCTDDILGKRDLLTLKSRFEHEGLSFLTITLPSIGKDLEQALANGRIDSTLFRSFRKCAKAPAFLRGFFSRVFDEKGRIYDEPCISAIEGIRQIAYTFKKLEVDCSPNRTMSAFTKFKTVEQVFQEPLALDDLNSFDHLCSIIWGEVFAKSIDFIDDLRPRHGPGATAERISGNAKYNLLTWYDRLEPYFPLLDYGFTSVNAHESEEFQRVTIVSEDDELPVRVVSVPKTLKAPRIIAIEPVCMQYAQQALKGYLYDLLESHPLTVGHVNFRDQDINRGLVMSASANGKLATLDLSSASDRVPYSLALRMFRGNPDLMGAVDACRSRRVQMPSGEVFPTKKFASMGSALCFPVEAMYFYTLCIMARLDKQNLPYTRANVLKAKATVFIYGDDIIVPTDDAGVVTETLHKYYCKVNTDKSFSDGYFRESCGMDCYAGEEVTPTYLRKLPPGNKRDASTLVSWTETSNLFYKRGYWRTSQRLLTTVESILGKLPIVADSCAGLGKISFQPMPPVKPRGRYQRPEVKAFVPSPVYTADRLDGYPALTKCLLQLEGSLSTEPRAVDEQHLERFARHGAVTLKSRWTPPY